MDNTLQGILNDLYRLDTIADYKRHPEGRDWVVYAHNGHYMVIGEEVETVEIADGVKTVTDWQGLREEPTDEEGPSVVNYIRGFTYATYVVAEDGVASSGDNGGDALVSGAREVVAQWASRNVNDVWRAANGDDPSSEDDPRVAAVVATLEQTNLKWAHVWLGTMNGTLVTTVTVDEDLLPPARGRRSLSTDNPAEISEIVKGYAPFARDLVEHDFSTMNGYVRDDGSWIEPWPDAVVNALRAYVESEVEFWQGRVGDDADDDALRTFTALRDQIVAR